MKGVKIPVFLLAALLLTAAFSSCGLRKTKITVSVTLSVMDSETGFCGTLFADAAYRYELGAPTVDGVLRQTAGEMKTEYFFDGSFIAFDAYAFYDSPDHTYSRAWTVTLNGKTPENGVLAHIAEGDVIELKYMLFVHE